MSLRRILPLVLILATGLNACTSKAPDSQTTIPAPASYIENKGSDTIVNLALAWAETYQNENPAVRISVSGGGTGTGISALINKTVTIANASRKIKEEELASAKKAGVNPTEFVVARDAIAVIVNPENPIDELTLQEISDIFSGKINNWSELGGDDRPIVRLSRETNSGTHVYFLERVLRLGDSKNKTLFSMDTLLLPSSEGITAEVKDNPNAIGYDGLGYVVPEVKVLAVAAKAGGDYVLPSTATVNNGTYPIARDLYMYTNGEPSGDVKAYLEWIVSPEAQKIVNSLGFVPIPGAGAGK
jgi:phosphate transport system substrate-binding protein